MTLVPRHEVNSTLVFDQLTRGSDKTEQISIFGIIVIAILPYNG